MKNVTLGCLFLAMIFGLGACASAKKSEIKKDRVTMLMDVASASLAEGDATSAIIALDEAKEINSDVPEIYYLYSLAYYRKGEVPLALDAAKNAVALDPKYSQAKNTLGKIYLEQGNFAQAQKYLAEAANDLKNRDAYIAQTNLGLLFYKQGKSDKALVQFNRAIQDQPSIACTATFYRGQIELDQNDLNRAQSDFDRSSKAECGGMTDAHLALGKTFVRMKKYDQARAKFLEIQQLFPQSTAADAAGELLREIP